MKNCKKNKARWILIIGLLMSQVALAGSSTCTQTILPIETGPGAGSEKAFDFTLIANLASYQCDSNSHWRAAHILGVGPGVEVDLGGVIGVICSSDQDGLNVGVRGGVAALFGLNGGLYVGESGLCAVGGFSLGLGAEATLSTLFLR